MRLAKSFWTLILLASAVDASTPCIRNPKITSELIHQAESGDAEAQYELGRAYERSTHHHARDYAVTNAALSQSVFWWSKAAAQGHAKAQFELGMAYHSGRGTRGDLAVAEYWWRKAADQGEVRAQFWLGLINEDHYSQKRQRQNYPEALKWLRLAARQDDADAENALGRMYENGEGVPQDYAVAAKWYLKAAEHVPDYGAAGEAQNNLGLLYYSGRGVPQDYVMAYMYFALTPEMNSLEQVANRMSQAQIAEAQRRTKQWIRDHPPHPLCTPNTPIPEIRDIPG